MRLTRMIRDHPRVRVRYDPVRGRRVLLDSPADDRSHCEPALVLDGTVTSGFVTLDDIEPEQVIALEVYWNRSELRAERVRPPLEPREGSGEPPLSVYGAPPVRLRSSPAVGPRPRVADRGVEPTRAGLHQHPDVTRPLRGNGCSAGGY